MHTFTLYNCAYRENARNTYYPNRIAVSSAEDLRGAVMYDHVAALYRDNRRGRHSHEQRADSPCEKGRDLRMEDVPRFLPTESEAGHRAGTAVRSNLRRRRTGTGDAAFHRCEIIHRVHDHHFGDRPVRIRHRHLHLRHAFAVREHCERDAGQRCESGAGAHPADAGHGGDLGSMGSTSVASPWNLPAGDAVRTDAAGLPVRQDIRSDFPDIGTK